MEKFLHINSLCHPLVSRKLLFMTFVNLSYCIFTRKSQADYIKKLFDIECPYRKKYFKFASIAGGALSCRLAPLEKKATMERNYLPFLIRQKGILHLVS